MTAAERANPSRLVLLGHPLGHTLSPALHRAALSAAGLAHVTYSAIDVAPDALDQTLRDLVDEGAAGNVTRPHKRTVAARCARRTEAALRADAANTFWVEAGTLCGDNTDVGGFDLAARALLGGPPTDQRVALLGAGGAAAAVLLAVHGWPGTRVTVFSRTQARAEALARAFPSTDVGVTAVGALSEATLVVNATPVGQSSDEHPVGIENVPRAAAVLDLVYRRGETTWVQAARARGHRAADGLPMLVEQAALAFARWFGLRPDVGAMWDAVGGMPSWMRPRDGALDVGDACVR